MSKDTTFLVLPIVLAMLGVVLIASSTVFAQSPWMIFGIGGLLTMAGLAGLLRYIVRHPSKSS